MEMDKKTRNAVKTAMFKIQEAIDVLDEAKGVNKDIDATAENLRFSIAELEFEVNV